MNKRTELSPAFIYLEQVCQKLEHIAREQIQNQTVQKEADVFGEHQDIQVKQVMLFIYSCLIPLQHS